ncbi:hypothetical protein [Burkholderia cenocepacia]|uniref:hypothetical protein n=1 Tax=Burkholderia cenocepacia TaxID=95486 RepID=UPI001F4A2AFD|nr:hypothetical protein [Burkholderia cenocepacia]
MSMRLDPTSGAIFKARLTWLAGGIAPFESAWSVFARVMATNFLTWSELRRLISDSAVPDQAGAEFISAKSIALDRYAALLGESRAVLETGFLDTLGFAASLLGTRGVRHCPACAKAGYHCTLFALGGLTHCPWHRIPLAPRCLQCAKTVRAMHPRDFFETHTCPACGTLIVDPVRRIAGVTDPELRRRAEACCREITEWWRAVGNRQQSANELMGDALGVANVAEREHLVALKWGAVSGLACPPECWMTGTGATPATIVQWTMHTRDTTDDVEAGRILAVRLYRSVRRQIFRKFVRPHRQCLSILTSAKRADLYGLDREQACALCLAFIAWRQATEQSADAIEQALNKLRETNAAFPHGCEFQFQSAHRATCSTGQSATFQDRETDRSIRHWTLRLPTLGGFTPSIELIPHMLYAEFLRIWMELEVRHLGSNLKVVVNPLRGGNLSLPVTKIVTPSESRESPKVTSWAVVVPDGRDLARQALERCTQRELHRRSMFDGRSQFYSDIFDWRSSESIDLLFMLRYRDGSATRVFRYINP